MPVTVPAIPEGMPQAVDRGLTIDVVSVPVHRRAGGDVALASLTGAAEVQIACPFGHARVTPAALGIEALTRDGRARFRVAGPGKLRVEVPHAPPLHLLLRGPAPAPPSGGGRVIVYEPGRVHDVGPVELRDGDTAYLAPGAVVRGAFHAHHARNVSVIGQGIIDGSWCRGCYTDRAGGMSKGVEFEACQGCRVEGVTVLDNSWWGITPCVSQDVNIRDVAVIGSPRHMSNDGIDVVASRRVTVEDAYVHTNDDCLAVKSTDDYADCVPWPRTVPHLGDCEDVAFRRCVLSGIRAGGIMEIGFEARAERFADISFEHVDVLESPNIVFSIHNGDRATITGVRYERVRVERFFRTLIDVRVLASRWSRDAERGRVRDVMFRDVTTCADPYNTPSLIGGWDADHDVAGVRFERCRVGDRPVTDGDALHLFTKHARDISYG